MQKQRQAGEAEAETDWRGRLARKAGEARKLRRQLMPLGVDVWKERMLSFASLGGLLTQRAAGFLSPKGSGGCDHNALERCANCVTSAPYALCGVAALRQRKTRAGKFWGCSLLGVCAGSYAFHGSSGRVKPACRRLDYWGSSVACTILLRAVYPSIPRVLTGLALVATPFKPFLVSAFSTAAMEVKYLQRARRNPKMRRVHRLHAASCLAGLTCFTVEVQCPAVPLMHACWHCLSATATATVNHLLAELEEQEGSKLDLTPLTL